MGRTRPTIVRPLEGWAAHDTAGPYVAHFDAPPPEGWTVPGTVGPYATHHRALPLEGWAVGDTAGPYAAHLMHPLLKAGLCVAQLGRTRPTMMHSP